MLNGTEAKACASIFLFLLLHFLLLSPSLHEQEQEIADKRDRGYCYQSTIIETDCA